jgi:spermidine synthase
VVPLVRGAYLGLGDASFAVLSIARALLAAVVLLPPTILMGATIPILARAAQEGEGWSRGVTSFYAANTAGAVAGAAIAGFWSIPALGVRASVVLAAILGASAAGIAVAAARAPDAAPAPPPADAAPLSDDARRALTIATALTAMSGACGLAGEVLWTRVLRLVVHGTTTAFAAMLVNYLLGIALGALIAPALAKRFGAARSFGAIQLLLVPATGVAMAVAPWIPRLVPLLRHAPDVVAHETPVLLLASALLLFPVALLTGTGLPLTWAIAEETTGDAGAASGRLLAANTAGGLAGALAAGFVLVPSLGTEASLLVVAALSAVASAIALRASIRSAELLPRIAGATAPFAALAGVLFVQPTIDLPYLLASSQTQWPALIAGPGESWRENLVFLREGRNTTVSVTRFADGLSLYNDGRPESGIGRTPPGFGAELALLGALPGLFAAERERALVVGLGGGHTTAIALASGFDEVVVVELEDAVVDASRLLYEAVGRPVPLDDPRARLVVDDGRNRIALTPDDALDAVVSQPSHPWLAGTSALYSRELFDDVERALRPGGVFALWLNLFRMDLASLRSVLATLSDVFPHVAAFVVDTSSIVIAASDAPFDWARAGERLAEMEATPSMLALRDLGTIPQLAAALELDTAAVRALSEGAERLSDDRPVLEARLARLPNGVRLELAEIDRAVRDVPWSAGLEGAGPMQAILDRRIEAVAPRAAALDRVAASIGGLAPDPALRALAEGRVADARGDVGAALRAYDASALPEAATAADRVRLAERRYDAALAHARARTTLPTTATPLLEAAIALDRPAALGEALALARRVAAPSDARLAALVEAYSRGCAALLADPSVDEGARASYPLARVAARCAVRAGDGAADRFEERAWRHRTIEANRWTAIGELASAGGNGGLAWLAFRRALEIYPSSSRAAVGLAQLHARDGRPEMAHAVLAEAWAATEGLREARGRIAGAAAALGLDLGEAAPPERDRSSSSTQAPEPPQPE